MSKLSIVVKPNKDVEYWQFDLKSLGYNEESWSYLTPEEQRKEINDLLSDCNDEIKWELEKIQGVVKH